MKFAPLIMLLLLACRDAARELRQINTRGFEPVIVSQIEAARADVQSKPESAAAWGKLGMVLHAYELNAEARACYAQAESLDSKAPRWPYLHALLLRPHDPARALARFERAAKLSRDPPYGARAALEKGESVKAMPDPVLAEVTKLRVGLKAWSDEAQQLLTERKHAQAAPLIARLTQTYPNAPEGWLLLGRLRLEQNDCAGAERALQQLLMISPDSINAHAQLGMALICLERYHEAIPILQRALQLKPDAGEVHFNLGFALARSGNGHAAIPSFRNAIRYNPDFIDPYITLADLLIQTGETPEASNLLARALQLNPGDPRAQTLLRRLQP